MRFCHVVILLALSDTYLYVYTTDIFCTHMGNSVYVAYMLVYCLYTLHIHLILCTQNVCLCKYILFSFGILLNFCELKAHHRELTDISSSVFSLSSFAPLNFSQKQIYTPQENVPIFRFICLIILEPEKNYKQRSRYPTVDSAIEKGGDYPSVIGNKISSYGFERHCKQMKYFQLHTNRQKLDPRIQGVLQTKLAAAKDHRWHEVRDVGKRRNM